MFSSLQRLQNISSIATTAIMCLLAAISLTSYVTIPKVEMGKIGVQQFVIVPGTGHQGGLEFALMRFDVQADLTPLFKSWNTKQLYVSITADFNNTKEGTENSIVLWDRIITRKRPRDARLRIDGGKPRNVWKGKQGTFRNIPSTALTLRYDLMPYVGLLTPGIGARARNPSYQANGTGLAGQEWELEVPRVKSGGIGS